MTHPSGSSTQPVDSQPSRPVQPEARPEVPDDVADVVLGQAGMAYWTANRTDGKGLAQPTAVAVDRSVEPYRLYVVDAGNHRVVGYRAPMSDKRPVEADIVLGQADLNTAFHDDVQAGRMQMHAPMSVAVDPQGNVYVADNEFHRVLLFDRPFETDTLADRVFGQGDDFDSIDANVGGISASSLAYPNGVWVDPDTGHLWVADTGNNRVLCYFDPLSSDTTADFVIGQERFTSMIANPGGVSARSLFGPLAVTTNGKDVLVSDSANRRVLLYLDPLGTDTVADHVWGQDGSFTAKHQGCSPFRFSLPGAVSATPTHVLISDSTNNRVLMFGPAGSANPNPIGLLGQGRNLHSCEPNVSGVGPGSLAFPTGQALSPDGRLWIADRENHRVLGILNALGGNQLADHVIGQLDLTRGTENFLDGQCFWGPRSLAVDRSVEPNRLYVSDYANHRVLGYASVRDLGPDTQPALVIGQRDAFSKEFGAGRDGLCMPTAVTVDRAGGLFVADRENNRILYFERPFETDVIADRVFGQPDYDTSGPNTGGVSARSLNRPEGLAIDDAGHLYVADTRNHRVLRFDRAVASDAVADLVWGQGGRFEQNDEYGGTGVQADTLSYPFGLAVRSDGLLAVADTNNHRVLLFNTRAADPLQAIQVFGQGGDLTSHRDNLGGCSARSLSGPEGVLFWRDGLYVSDTANSRILHYRDIRTAEAADKVYGQLGSFETHVVGKGGTGPQSLWFPSGLDVDSEGTLYVADRDHNRILVFHR